MSFMEEMIMTNEVEAVKAQFIKYSKVFNKLKPELIPPFFHLPSMLMTTKVVATMTTAIEVEGVFTQFMDSLRDQNFTHSKLDIDNLGAKILSENIAIVSGAAIRYKKDPGMVAEVELEQIGVTYTFRKDVSNDWKIIAGIIHDPENAIIL